MTLRQIIEKLRKEGHEVEYIEEKPLKSKKGGKRTTGQIRITKLDNLTIKGNNKSLLNKKAREMSAYSLKRSAILFKISIHIVMLYISVESVKALNIEFKISLNAWILDSFA